jgi:DNA-binding MarR family transcriptional regulator
MPRENIRDLLAFLAVAKEQSFTKAAAKLGVSQSALSHTIRGLEEGLGLRLLMRTTRSVSPTEAGERLLRTVGPRFDEIKTELAALSELRDKPAGTIRITAGEHAAEAILWPAVARLLPHFKGIAFDYTQKEAKYDALRGDAVRDALRKANSYVNGLGLKLGRVLEIATQVPYPAPGSMPSAGGAMLRHEAAAVPVEPGSEVLRTEVQVTW